MTVEQAVSGGWRGRAQQIVMLKAKVIVKRYFTIPIAFYKKIILYFIHFSLSIITLDTEVGSQSWEWRVVQFNLCGHQAEQGG